MKQIRTWLTTVLVILVLRSEVKECPHHLSPVSAKPALVAKRLESLPPLEGHLEHLHDEMAGTAQVLSPAPAQIEIKAVSIVTPLYNEGGLFSVWWLDRPSFWRNPSIESVPIDDGSPDNTATRLAALRDRTIKPVVLEASHGYCESLRRGIDVAAGDYVVVATLDSLRELTTLEPLLEPLRSNSAVLAVLVRRRSPSLSASLVAWATRLLVRLRLHIHLTDLVPGCWAVRGPMAKRLARDLPPADFFLGAVHWIARSGGQIVEIPFDACVRCV